uniref:Uncharacterized protein LOC116289411 isoform X2 n=1 Tax=Actinia tenebrosa TaxID=6105 RepID=A0A6P8H710_ACTTE
MNTTPAQRCNADLFLSSVKSTMEEKWQQIANDITSGETTSISDKGSLVVVGSGIMCVSQFTIQALCHIKDADKVFYLVSDPVTEVYIQELKPEAIDLFVLYGEDKDRHETYAQITEVLLHYTRRGNKVVAVFYGHPGYLVNPARQAIRIAQSEGLSATELPGISSLDIMISELGFEPGIPGLQVFEATDLLMYSRKLLTDCHVVINQVGCVGDVTFHFGGFPNPHFPVLIKYLIGFYGNDHVVYHYIGSQFPVCKSLVQTFKLADLLMPDNAANIQSMSTMYLPPSCEGVLNLEMAKNIGMVTATKAKFPSTESTEDIKEQGAVKTNYPFKDIQAEEPNSRLKGFSAWSIPQNYKPARNSPLTKYLIDVSQSPEKVREFRKGKGYPSLPEYQAKALRTRDSDWIRFSLENDQSFAETVIMKTALKKISGTSEVRNKDDGLRTTIPTTEATRSPDSEIVGSDRALVESNGQQQVDGAPITAKPTISVPRKANAVIAESDRVSMDSNGIHQVDGTTSAPRKANAVIAGSDRALLDSDGMHQVDGSPITAKPTISVPRKANAVIAGSDRVSMDSDGIHEVDGIIRAPRKAFTEFDDIS